MPDFLSDILISPTFSVFARTLFTSFFWFSGVFSLFRIEKTINAMKQLGLPAPAFVTSITIGFQIIGSVLIITNFKGVGWLGAGALAVFTALTIPISHPFWKFKEGKRIEELHSALEHLTVIGGFMLVAIILL